MKIRPDVLRTYQSLHTWTGILSGLVLFIGFFAGALLMFQQPLSQWATPPQHHLPAVKADQLDELLAKTFAEHPYAANGLTLNLDGQTSPIIWYEKGESRELALDDVVWHGTLNEQGELVAERVQANELTAMLDYLHRSAGILGEIGHDHLGVYILGIAGALYFIALISGVIFLLPTLVKSFFALRTNKGANRFWLDSHNLIGIGSLPFHLVIAFTVVVFAYHDVLYGGLKVFVYGEQPMFERTAPPKADFNVADLPSIESIIAEAKSYGDDGYEAVQIDMQGLNGKRPSMMVYMDDESAMMRGPITDYFVINPYNSHIFASSYRNDETGFWERMVATFFAVHFGSYGGDLGRWLYFFMGLAGAFMFYSGNLLWLEKRRNKKSREQSRSVTIMAKLTVGVCLGCMGGIAACLAGTKWLVLSGININYAYMWIYYLVFFAAMGFALGVRPSFSSIWLLRLTAVLAALIPVSSVIGAIAPSLGPWETSGFASLMVDIVAVGFAAMFWYSANKVRYRAEHGEPNSIWAR